MSDRTTPSQNHAFALRDSYLHIDGTGGTEIFPGGPGFWASIGSGERRLDGRLIGAMRTEEGSSSWEMHPKGDEFLYCVSGAIDVVLRRGGDEQTVHLHDGMACIVPQGVWHKQIFRVPSELLFMTQGEGTEHDQGPLS